MLNHPVGKTRLLQYLRTYEGLLTTVAPFQPALLEWGPRYGCHVLALFIFTSIGGGGRSQLLNGKSALVSHWLLAVQSPLHYPKSQRTAMVKF